MFFFFKIPEDFKNHRANNFTINPGARYVAVNSDFSFNHDEPTYPGLAANVVNTLDTFLA